MKNTESLSILVQWDAVDDFLHTIYTVTWTSNRDNFQVFTVEEQTSYLITLDTVYTITVTPANSCGGGPEFMTTVSLLRDVTSTTSSISPTFTANTNPMIIKSTNICPTTTALISSIITITTITTVPITTVTTTVVETSVIPTVVSSSIMCTTTTTATTTTATTTTTTTTNTTTTTITTTTLHATTVTTTVVESPVIPTATAYPTTATTTNIANSPNPTGVPADTTTTDETSKFSNTANKIISYIII